MKFTSILAVIALFSVATQAAPWGPGWQKAHKHDRGGASQTIENSGNEGSSSGIANDLLAGGVANKNDRHTTIEQSA
ncbi:hypothetical protein DFQ28_010947 [Apophysomyces sp. BC1034]|nr:hypothetical protein DFQ30_008557 [Apophysomyces sp. BC1015]KAG0173429.1 hypothetical protein DFQ29_007961 [Apophysomyces sp. BC1021]KAG0184540.1 hypothetical protein DFQ28_010947 [Apophysomyces sp. BC1034]